VGQDRNSLSGRDLNDAEEAQARRLKQHALAVELDELREKLKDLQAELTAVREQNRIRRELVETLRLESLPEMQKAINAWQDKTFPHATPTSIMTHMVREITELFEAHDPAEAADVLILLIAHAGKCGYNLWTEVVKKMEQNYQRKWQAPDTEGVVEHVR
jgi:NTP pyrophosphatase (non-canonical NTP hydrolase)